MVVPNKYKRLESCSKEELIEKIIVRDRHCNDLKRLLDKGLEKYKKLEEENQTLKDNIEFLHSCLDDRDNSIEIMQEENKKLKESLDIATKCSSKEEDGIIRLSEENKKLKDENVDIKSELSKFRDSFKKYRDYEKEELAESCYDLARENEKLKDIIGKIVYLYKEEPTELEEYVKSGFKGGMSN